MMTLATKTSFFSFIIILALLTPCFVFAASEEGELQKYGTPILKELLQNKWDKKTVDKYFIFAEKFSLANDFKEIIDVYPALIKTYDSNDKFGQVCVLAKFTQGNKTVCIYFNKHSSESEKWQSSGFGYFPAVSKEAYTFF